MRLARWVTALGALLLVLGFAVAVSPRSVELDGREERCDYVLAPGLLAGQPTVPRTSPTGAERRADAVCKPVERRADWLAWGALGLGALVLLGGSTAVREADRAGGRRTGAVVRA